MSEPEITLDSFREQYKVKEFHKDKLESNGAFDSNGGSLSDYSYIGKLIQKPIADGRHRILWLILAPWAVNILKLSEEDAYELIETYLNECNEVEGTTADQNIQYNIDYAITTDLYPPRLSTLEENDPDLYGIIIKAIGEQK